MSFRRRMPRRLISRTRRAGPERLSMRRRRNRGPSTASFSTFISVRQHGRKSRERRFHTGDWTMRRTAEALFRAQVHRARLVTGVTFLLALLYAGGPASAGGEQTPSPGVGERVVLRSRESALRVEGREVMRSRWENHIYRVESVAGSRLSLKAEDDCIAGTVEAPRSWQSRAASTTSPSSASVYRRSLREHRARPALA